jgi:hypothetical protein
VVLTACRWSDKTNLRDLREWPYISLKPFQFQQTEPERRCYDRC